MSVLAKIDSHILALRVRLSMWRDAVRGLLLDVLMSPDAHTRPAANRLQGQLRDARTLYSDTVAPREDAGLYDLIPEIVETACSDSHCALPSDEVARITKFGHDLIDALYDDTRAALKSDCALTTAFLRRVQIQASLQIARGMAPSAAMAMVRGGALQGFKLVRRDALGRLRSSESMIRLSARGALMDLYNHAFVCALLHAGDDLARIDTTVFSITGRPGYPSMTDVERQMHPNAQHLVSRP